jgi:hypothetical protein
MVCTLVALGVSGAAGQASLSTQGFGYPPGQLSSRAHGTGGAVADIDPWSPINPASLATLGSRMLFFQIEPEYRTVTSSKGPDRTTTARYPVVFGAMPVGERWVVSLGASTLLDRTATTIVNSTRHIGADSEPVTTTSRVNGAIDDVRLAAAFMPAPWLRLGVGAHAITGRNLVTITQAFTDTSQFQSFALQRTLGYSGDALSAGAQLLSKTWIGAASFRYGGTIHLSASDTVLSNARVPNRFSGSLAYIGIANSAVAIRTSHETWSSLGNLGVSAAGRAKDTWDSSIGADLQGPRIGSHLLNVRGGFRTRTLPFQAAGHDVTEHSITGGLGSVFGGGRAVADLALIHSTRDANLPASEKAWTFSIGISVRP